MDSFFYKRFFHFIINFFVIFICFSFSSVNAQELSERWVCLNSEPVGVHDAKLTVKQEQKLLPNSDTYIVVCVSDDIHCTTGNSNLDLKVFKKDNLSLLKSEFNYKFEDMSPIRQDENNIIKSDTEGFLSEPIIWRDSTPDSRERKWLALNYFDPEASLGTGDNQTPKSGTFTFEEAFTDSKCVTLKWDPFGRVFDAETLEPIYGARVSLFIKENNNYRLVNNKDIIGGIVNPFITKEDGAFSFVVPDGTYKLVVELSEYKFPTELSEINSNYSKIYSDIYPALTKEEIIQRGKIEHRDIPIKSLTKSQSRDVVLLEKFEDLNKINSILNLSGRVSHPFTKISAYSLELETNQRLREIASVNADKDGKFNLKVNLSNLGIDEYFGDLILTKVDLTENNFTKFIDNIFSFLIKKADAQKINRSYRLNPILNYIEGYAYDKNGKIIPNAKVQVVLAFSQSPSYTTEADEKGFFRINSNYLPRFPYKLVFVSSLGEKSILSTSDFVTKNKDFLISNKLNLNQRKTIQISKTLSPKVNSRFLSQTSDKKNNFNNDNSSLNGLNKNNFGNNSGEIITKKNFSNSFNNQLIMLVFFLIILILLVIGLLYFYIIKKKSSTISSTF